MIKYLSISETADEILNLDFDAGDYEGLYRFLASNIGPARAARTVLRLYSEYEIAESDYGFLD